MFQIDSYPELIALFRAVIEAKFHANPEDLDVPGSTILANVAIRLTRAKVDEEVKLYGEAALSRWQAWARTGPEREEWKSSLRYAASMWKTIWSKWSVEERRSAARTLLSPFELDEVMVDVFLREVEATFTPNH
jgi:hypothetical protein